jgi:hypothetical protein
MVHNSLILEENDQHHHDFVVHLVFYSATWRKGISTVMTAV